MANYRNDKTTKVTKTKQQTTQQYRFILIVTTRVIQVIRYTTKTGVFVLSAVKNSCQLIKFIGTTSQAVNTLTVQFHLPLFATIN